VRLIYFSPSFTSILFSHSSKKTNEKGIFFEEYHLAKLSFIYPQRRGGRVEGGQGNERETWKGDTMLPEKTGKSIFLNRL
jgi:hypothetical protein